MPPVFVPFDGWSPSKGYFGEGWETFNLYPSFGTWRPWRQFDDFTATAVVDGPMTGRHVHIWSSGVGGGTYAPDAPTLFCGSPTKLYSVNSATGSFTDLSGAAYNSNGAGWRFASVGNDIWAVNWLDEMQRRTNNAGAFANGVVSTFKPKPRFVATVREHLVGANLSNAGRFQDEVVWSDADDATNFDPATGVSTSLAASKRLTSIPGQITGLVGGQWGYAFKRDCVFILEYTGTTQVFRPDVLDPTIGTSDPSSIVRTRNGLYFRGPEGFYVIRGISPPQRLPIPGVDQFLLDGAFSERPASYVANIEDMRTLGFQHPTLPLIGWAIRRNWDFTGCDEALLFNTVTEQWAYVQVEVPGSATSTAVTALAELPYGTDAYDALGAFKWNPASGLSMFSRLGSAPWGAVMSTRYRPANFETATRQGQTSFMGILPMFSKTVSSAPALTPSVTVATMLDPFNDEFRSETRSAADRDSVSGMIPFQIAGRLLKVTIACTTGEDFADFPGMWIFQEQAR